MGFKPPIQVNGSSNIIHGASQQIQKDPNHFAGNYGTPGCTPDVLNTNMIAAHELAYKAAEKIGVKIYNATLGGELEVYPRVDFHKVVNYGFSNPGKVIVSTSGRTITYPAPNNCSPRGETKINLIDVGNVGGLFKPWDNHQEKIGKRLNFEPRETATGSDNIISKSACLWEKAEERNFYIYRGFNGTGSSLFMQNYDFVLQNYESLKNQGSKSLAETWLERSLPVDVERVQCQTLDNVLDELNTPYPFHFLKIDAQGAEYQILKGAEKYLRKDCYGLQLELFVLPLYKGIRLLDDVVVYLDMLGFELVKKYPAHGSFSSQHDCVFLRRGINDEIMRSIRQIYGVSESISQLIREISNKDSIKEKQIPVVQEDISTGISANVNSNKKTITRLNNSISLTESNKIQNQMVIEQILKRSNEYMSKFQNCHNRQRCVIIGNGPSLNKMDLSFLKNEITFGMNKIFLLFDKWNFKPSYYVSVNPLVIEQSVEQIYQIDSPKFLSFRGLPFIQHRENISFIRSVPNQSFSMDPRNGLWEGHTVTYVAMQLAYFMGFSEVVLIGVDHYFKSQGPANKEVVSEGDDPNHFHPQYFGKGVRWNLPDLEKSEIAYNLAKQAFEADGKRIIDATLDGHLTIFPKADYRKVFESSLCKNQNNGYGSNSMFINNFLSKEQTPQTIINTNSYSNVSNQKYLVSAIVSTYNSEKYIRGCLEDLESQTISDKLEIIVVNSGSQQNEDKIVKEFQQRYDNIKYIHTEQRENIYQAWNRAAKIASGKYITNANTDDCHRNDAFELMVNTLESNPHVGLVYGDQIMTNTPNDTFANNHGTEELRRSEYSRQRLLFGCCTGSQPMWRRSLHDELGYFDESLTCAGDWDFWLRISEKYDLKRIPELLGLYYYNKEGIEHSGKIHNLYERYIVGKRYGNPYISIIPLYNSPGNPLVSIIMPAYNSGKYIARAIESAMIQNYRNFELIIVDDGSTDNTRKIIAGFESEGNIKYYYQENRGPANARNNAIKKSKGDYIVVLDSDDMLTPDCISRHLHEFEMQPDTDFVYCDDYLIDENAKPVRVIERREYPDKNILIRDMFRNGFPVIHFKTCIRRRVFDKIGFFDEDLLIGEDYDMMRRLIRQDLKIRYLKGPWYLRRIYDNSLTKCVSQKKADNLFDILERFTNTFEYKELFPDINWNNVLPGKEELYAKCLTAETLIGIGKAYLNSEATHIYAYKAFEKAKQQYEKCLEMEPENPFIQKIVQQFALDKVRIDEDKMQTIS